MGARETVIIVGAGPSGLTTSYHLKELNVPHVVLERGSAPGSTFGRMRASMELVSPPFFSELPGLGFPEGSPRFLTMPAFQEYLKGYAVHHRLPVKIDAEVKQVTRARPDAPFVLELAGGQALESKCIVCATGVFSTPHIPRELAVDRVTVPWLHSAYYQAPRAFAGRNVLIVGGGLSAQEIALELAEHAPVTMAARVPLKWIPNPVLGIDLHWFAWLPEMIPVRWIPWAVKHAREPASGAPIRAALKSNKIRVKPGVTRLDGDTAHFADGTSQRYEAFILATGFRPTVRWLDGLASATGERIDDAPDGESSAHPGLYFVGFPFLRTFASRYLRGIRRDARHTAQRIADRVAQKALVVRK